MLTLAAVLLAAALFPRLLPTLFEPAKVLDACKNNLKEIGLALVGYSVDHPGRYPTGLTELTPHYLTRLPRCPAGGSYRYLVSSDDYHFTVVCAGDNHARAGKARDDPYATVVREMAPGEERL